MKNTCVTCRQPLSRQECAVHPDQYADNCPYCDLCEHGVNRFMHCDECHKNDDNAWRTAPPTDAEIEELRREVIERPNAHPQRGTPYPLRNYRETSVSLWGVLLNDYERLKNVIGENK